MTPMMPFQRSFLPLLALILLCISSSSQASKNEKSWTLYHAWKGHDFSKRGKITLGLTEGEPKAPILEMDNAAAADSLQDFPLESLYQLKLVEDGTKNSVFTITSVPACQVHRSNFRDELILTLNNGASVVSMAYIPLVSPLAPSCQEFVVNTSAATTFSSKVSFETATPGMTVPAVLPGASKPPPGLKFLKTPSGKTNPIDPNNTNQQEPIKSPMDFIKRYWYVLLPLFIMSMTSGGGEPEQAPHPSQAAQGGGATTSHPSQATSGGGGGQSASSSSGAPRRRGKRG